MAAKTEPEAHEKGRQQDVQASNTVQQRKKSMSDPNTQLEMSPPPPPQQQQPDKWKRLSQDQQRNQNTCSAEKTDRKVSDKKVNGSSNEKGKRRDRRTKDKHQKSQNGVGAVKDEDRKKDFADKKGCVVEKNEGEDGEGGANPLSVDLYARLTAENRADSDALDLDGALVGSGLILACKRLPYLEKYFHTLLMVIFLGATFAMVFGLCVLQAQMSMHTKELLAKVQGPKKPMPEGVYSLYYDYLDSGVLPENVDMRANTTIFVH